MPTVEQDLEDQSGFISNRSTCDQILALTNYIENDFQQMEETAGYNTVWHTGLLVKMSKMLP